MSENSKEQQEERRKIREAASRLAEKTGLDAGDIEIAILKVLMGGPISELEDFDIIPPGTDFIKRIDI